MMKIDRVLNNNAVFVVTDNGSESVALGRGIGWNKKKGDIIQESDIESHFFKSQGGIHDFFADILSEMPPIYLTLTDQVIKMAREDLQIELQDTLFLSLCDHINFAVLRYKKGMTIRNQFYWEIKQFYPLAYSVGEKALALINKTLELDIPTDEAAFIALHLVNAAGENNMKNVIQKTEIVKDILSIIKYDLNINWNVQDINYQRLLTHLKSFAQRLSNKNLVDHEQVSLYDDIDQRLSLSWNTVNKIETYLNKKHSYTLTYDEKAFLTIHIERVRNINLSNS
ncbi:BglG family transcription antiterminator LicT [Vibrio gazogenes]|nr:PRD domain-containing protein [Vibrio gazogenes]